MTYNPNPTVTVAGTTPVPAEQAEATKPLPRLADGKPDLTGIYNPASFSQMFGGRVTRGQNDPIVAKLKPGAEKYKVVRGPEDTGQFSDCMPTAVPNSYFVPYQWQIVHSKDYVVIMYEYPHLFRAIPIASATNPAEHPADPDPTWAGNSVAHWEGNTLVVDVIGFNDKTELPGVYYRGVAPLTFVTLDGKELKSAKPLLVQGARARPAPGAVCGRDGRRRARRDLGHIVLLTIALGLEV